MKKLLNVHVVTGQKRYLSSTFPGFCSTGGPTGGDRETFDKLLNLFIEGASQRENLAQTGICWRFGAQLSLGGPYIEMYCSDDESL